MVAELVRALAFLYLHTRASSTVLPCQCVGPTLPSVAAYKGQDQLPIPHTLRTGSPVPLPTGPAPLLSRQGPEPAFLSAIASEGAGLAFPPSCSQGHLSGLLQVARGNHSPTHATSQQTNGRTSSPMVSPALGGHGRRPAHPCPLHQGQHCCAI